MVETALTVQRVDPEKITALKEWLAELDEREAEAVETLREEDVYTESLFLRETDDGAYLVSYVEADDVDAAMAAYQQSRREIGREHRAVMADVLADPAGAERAEPLVHLTSPERPPRPE